MVSPSKQAYMKSYNRKPEVKTKKADYMRVKRAEENEIASRKLVTELLDLGFENLAFEYALERAPEMIATVKVAAKRRK